MLRVTLLVLGLSTLTAAVALQADKPGTATLRIELIDPDSGKPAAGVIQVTDASGKPVALNGLISRGQGLRDEAISRWMVVPGAVDVEVPAGKLKLAALRGLETERATTEIELAGGDKQTVKLPLVRFYDAGSAGWQSANTHIHLRKLSREQADRYLIEIPQADDLDGVFISYLERAGDDLEYTSNKYTDADFGRLARQTPVFIGNGEEHRHNLTPFDEGYGHVMFLNVKQLIKPASLGPGITKEGTDGVPIRQGIDQARADGATAIWCHNRWGFEDVPNWLTDRLDAQNIFDGGTHGSYKDSFYRYLNAGLKIPFSTGTDWFMYDFSRAYVRSDKPVDSAGWLKQLAAGKSYITNGPLLEFAAGEAQIGDVVKLDQAGPLRVVASATGRVDFERLELVRNGKVVATAKSQPQGGHFTAKLDQRLQLEGPGWLAVRTPPPPVERDPELQAPVPLNEYGRPLFAHSSAIYVEVAGRTLRDEAAVRWLIADIEKCRAAIAAQGKFANDSERQRILKIYDEALSHLKSN